MRIGILHLSDIHIEKSDDWICDKGEKIAQAIIATWEPLNIIFIVISGDVANKGSAKEYAIAKDFLNTIRNYFSQQTSSRIIFIVAPGNHDCNFSSGQLDPKGRNAFIEKVINDPVSIEKGDSIYSGLLSVQKDFFNFINDLECEVQFPTDPQITYEIKVEIDSNIFIFSVHNTAWMSSISEKQGGLIFPKQFMNSDLEALSRSTLTATIFHHPENWLDSNNATEFRRFTERNSDLILSGHEHTREVYAKRYIESEVETQIIRADALQERGEPGVSAFNLIIVDIESKKQKIFEFRWKDRQYVVRNESDWQEFIRNRFLQKQSFYHLPDFDAYLNNLGAINSNSRNRQIYLDDFFAPPRLLLLSMRDIIDGKTNKRIESEKFFEFIYNTKKLIIFGDTWQGKTTTAKKVFKDLYQKQIATVLLDGSKLRNVTEGSFRHLLKEEFSAQYHVDLLDKFLQFPKENKAVVIDNFGLFGASQQSLQKILEIGSKHFEYVIAFAHSDLQLQEFMNAESTAPKLSNYIQCRMLPLDQSQRGRLIRRWVRLNGELEESELMKQEHQLRAVIQEAINNGLIVSTPFFIFGVLQLVESFKTNPNAQFGSIGYIYQGVITAKLYELGKTPAQINKIFLVISLIAHSFYKNDVSEMDFDELDSIIKQYNGAYRESVNSSEFLNELQKTQILVKQSNGNWKFVGSQLRDFFVAKYFAQALGDEDSSENGYAKDCIQRMIETVIYESHTRILLFLVFEANSNKALIRWILNEAKIVYSTSQVTDLDSDVEFINKINQPKLHGKLLQSNNPQENQDQRDRNISSHEEEIDESVTERCKNNLVKYTDELDEFTKTAFALKMIELVGQLVKSFSGTIKAELKHDLIEECINVGLRLLYSIFKNNRDNLVELGDILKHLIRQQHPELSESNIENKKEGLLVLLHYGAALGVIKKISQSVGHTDLKESFNDVFSQKKLLSYQLVETAIRLDNYAPTADRLIRFGDSIKLNEFSYNLLRQLVADYVNYFDVDRTQRQKLVARFDLDGGSGEHLLITTKTDRTYHPSTSQKKKTFPVSKRKK